MQQLDGQWLFFVSHLQLQSGTLNKMFNTKRWEVKEENKKYIKKNILLKIERMDKGDMFTIERVN